MSDWNKELWVSSKILSSTDDHLRQWLVIIGLVTVILLVLLVCIRCILLIRHTYRTTDVNQQYSTSRKSFSHQRLLVNNDNSKCTCYPKFQCIKSTNSTRQISTKYPNYAQIHNETSPISVCTV
jgi:hypothetical protein